MVQGTVLVLWWHMEHLIFGTDSSKTEFHCRLDSMLKSPVCLILAENHESKFKSTIRGLHIKTLHLNRDKLICLWNLVSFSIIFFSINMNLISLCKICVWRLNGFIQRLYCVASTLVFLWNLKCSENYTRSGNVVCQIDLWNNSPADLFTQRLGFLQGQYQESLLTGSTWGVSWMASAALLLGFFLFFITQQLLLTDTRAQVKRIQEKVGMEMNLNSDKCTLI